MRSHNGYYEEFDDTEEFAYGRSRALQRLLDDCRREERYNKQQHGPDKYRYHRDSSDWEDDDDWDSYLDDNNDDILEELNLHY